jgi:hypothetical protein
MLTKTPVLADDMRIDPAPNWPLIELMASAPALVASVAIRLPSTRTRRSVNFESRILDIATLPGE